MPPTAASSPLLRINADGSDDDDDDEDVDDDDDDDDDDETPDGDAVASPSSAVKPQYVERRACLRASVGFALVVVLALALACVAVYDAIDAERDRRSGWRYAKCHVVEVMLYMPKHAASSETCVYYGVVDDDAATAMPTDERRMLCALPAVVAASRTVDEPYACSKRNRHTNATAADDNDDGDELAFWYSLETNASIACMLPTHTHVVTMAECIVSMTGGAGALGALERVYGARPVLLTRSATEATRAIEVFTWRRVHASIGAALGSVFTALVAAILYKRCWRPASDAAFAATHKII